MYSAVKVNGRKLYEYARAGQEVERPERQVTIYSFERTSPISYDEKLARFTFRVKCSKGTYIRTLSVTWEKTWLCGSYVTFDTGQVLQVYS